MKNYLGVLWCSVRFIIATILMVIFGTFYMAALLIAAIGTAFLKIGLVAFDEYEELLIKLFKKVLNTLGVQIEVESDE